MLPVARGVFDVTRDHWWWRDGWGPGTRYLTWHLTFEGADALHAQAARFAATASGVAHVDVVPRQWLHLTMSGVGHAGEFDGQAVDALAAEILEGARTLETSPLVFDRVGLYREGVSLWTDAPWLQELKRRQVAAIARVGGAQPDPDSTFSPHVSLAYFSGEVDEGAVTAAAAALDPVTVAGPTLSLIELGRDDRMYTWRALASARLG